jgi:serine/threonine-protein phosphatase 2A regulatory subunit A
LLPTLARQLGEEFFTNKLNKLSLACLKDPVHSVRETTISNYTLIVMMFGQDWAIKHFYPALLQLNDEVYYLFRLVP